MNMTIGRKLMIGLGAMVAVVLIMGVVFFYTSKKVQDAQAKYSSMMGLNTFLSEMIIDHLEWMDDLSSGVFIQGKKFTNKLNPEETRLGKWMASFKPYSEEVAAPFYSLKEPHAKLLQSAEKILSAYKAGNIDDAHTIFTNETIPAVELLNKGLYKIKEILEKDRTNVHKDLLAIQNWANVLTITFTIVIIIFAIGGGIIFVRGITNPVHLVMDTMQKVAEGDLTEKVNVKGSDEIGQMAVYTNKMVNSLGEIISQIKANAYQVASAAGEIASSSEQTSKNSEASAAAVEQMTSTMHEMSANIQSVTKNIHSQASSVTETSSSVDQMVASIQRVADNVKRLIVITQRAMEAVLLGKQAVEKSSHGMEDINRVTNKAAETITSLGGKTDDIGKIVLVIDDIAEQTNLLALNAAIEAAKAGEQGMGFAVVAEEVRKLAERSAKSTREIADLISSVTKESQDAVRHMNNNSEIVEQGLSLSREVNLALQRIEESVVEVSKYSQEIGSAMLEQSSGSEQIGKAVADLNEITQEISTSSEEQSAGVEQVVDAIEKVREMVQQSASASLQLASSAEELSKQAEGLQVIVGKFALNGRH